MTELVSGSAAIEKLYNNIGEYVSSPVRIAKATYDFIDEVLNNQISLVDPTNPFILGLEISAVQTALSINESLLNLRRGYVGLAQTDQDVYRHLTDTEFTGRFANPGYVSYTVMIQYDTLINNLLLDQQEDCNKGIIPRDTYITVDGNVFTFEYPIVIRQFSNGVLQISYDNSISSPISNTTNNIIQYKLRNTGDGTRWLYFTIPVKQMKINSNVFPLTLSSIFNRNIQFDDQFVYARVFQKSSSTNDQWSEIRTTHSDQIFDNNVATALLTVTTGQLNVNIPFIYNTLNKVSGQIRVDIYTTKGDISLNLGSYNYKQFTTTLRNIDDKRDTNIYTNIWGNVTFTIFSTDILNPGTNSIDFSVLKQKVIDYAFGNFNLPITNAQLDTVTESNGFKLVRNADTLTERFFLGIRAIPQLTSANSSQQILYRANIGMIRFSATINDLQKSDNVINNNIRFTLLSGTIFSLINGISKLVEQSEINFIKSQQPAQLVNLVNSNNYVYTPYYFVFDTEDQVLNVRPYDLDHPDIANLSFVMQNNTLALAVNTNTYTIEKVSNGYNIIIKTISSSTFKQLNDNQVGVQLRLTNEDGSLTGTINGIQMGTDPDTEERIYSFILETNYDVNKNNSIQLTNVYNNEGIISSFYINLNTKVDILYTTTNVTTNFVSDSTDNLINKSRLPLGSVGNSHDTVDLFLGEHLEHLWARVRSYASGNNYETSPVDVPAIYEKDEYEINPITGTMLFFDSQGNAIYNIKHRIGDPVLDADGNQVFLRQKGDPILDINGNPIPITSVTATNEFDILVIDGVFAFTSDSNYLTYRDQVTNLITGWITNDIVNVQAKLIERTEIFFYPEASLGITEIVINNNQTAFIDSEQVLNISVSLDKSVINDDNVKNTISNNIISYLDQAIRQNKFTINRLESDLLSMLGINTHGIDITGIGGDNNYRSITVSDQHNRLCIARKLVLNTDNTITIQPDVNINYFPF